MLVIIKFKLNNMIFSSFRYVFCTILVLLVSISTQAFEQDGKVPSRQIRLSGPAAVVSYPLMVMAEQNNLAKNGINFTFTQWQNPTQLRALVLSEQVDIAAMPSNVAAIFYNKGHALRLMNISVWDIMSIVSRDKPIHDLRELIDEVIVVPFKNEMPSIVLQQLLKAQLPQEYKKIKLRFSHNPLDASQLLLAGKVKHGLLIEPVASLALHTASESSDQLALYRSLNISQLWAHAHPSSPRLPQAGIVANTTISSDITLLAQLNHAYSQAAQWCNDEVSACAKVVQGFLPKMPLVVLETAIQQTQLQPKLASDTLHDLEAFFNLLAQQDSKLIGDQLPSIGFYLSQGTTR